MTVIKTGQVIVLKRPGEKSERVRLGSELKSGGAGSVYSIKDDLLRVIKIYNDETLRKEGAAYQEKIECMLGNVPKVAEAVLGDKDFVQLAWPLASAYTAQGKFVGFAMPMVDMQQTTELEFILSHKQAEKEGLPHHLGVGLQLAHNLAAVVSSIHVLGHAIVDLKPVNLKFFKRELYVAVLDCDGFYINVPGKAASAPQVTPDYLAPEFHDAPITTPEHQDRFALAVIIFQLLNYGIHPYAGVPRNNVQIPPDTEGKIKAGLYPYGLVPHKKVSPKLGSTHEAFPIELRLLFDHAFGGSPSLRPAAFEWAEALRKFATPSTGLITRCTSQHLHFKDMPCAACLREQVINSAPSVNNSKQKQRVIHTLSASTTVSSTVIVQPKIQQSRSNTLTAQPLVHGAGVKASFAQKISHIPTAEIYYVAMFFLSIAAFIADSGWGFILSAMLLFFPIMGSSDEIGVRAGEAAILAVIWFGILSIVQHYWEFVLIFGVILLMASALIFVGLNKILPQVKHHVGKSMLGVIALSALLHGLLWAGGGYLEMASVIRTEVSSVILGFNSLMQEKGNGAELQSLPESVQQVTTEQKLPQHTNLPPASVQQVAIEQNLPQHTDSLPVTTPALPIAQQEATQEFPVWATGPLPGTVADNVAALQALSEKGYIGITTRSLSTEIIHSLGLADGQGVLISEVLAAGPAAQAGMTAGDVMISIDGKTVGDESIRELIANLPVGKAVPVEIIRDGVKKYLIIAVVQKP